MTVHLEEEKDSTVTEVGYDAQGRPIQSTRQVRKEEASLADIDFDPQKAFETIGLESLYEKAGKDPQQARIMLANFIYDIAEKAGLDEKQRMELTHVSDQEFSKMLVEIGEDVVDPGNLDNLSAPKAETGKIHQFPTPNSGSRKKLDVA